MSKKTIVIILVMFTVPLIIYLVAPSDTKRIRTVIHEGSTAIMQKDLAGAMSHVSYNYRDRYGYTYLAIKETLKSLFTRNNSLAIELAKIEVDVDGDRADARILLRVKGVTGERETFLLGTEDVAESVIFSLEKERLKWYVVDTYFPTREGIAF